MAANLAEQIFDLLTKHDVDIMRVDAGTRARVVAMINGLEQDIVKKLRRFDPTGPATKTLRLKAMDRMVSTTAKTIEEAYEAIERFMAKEMALLGATEAATLAELGNRAMGFELLSGRLDPFTVKALTNRALVEGEFAQKWWKKQSQDLRNGFVREIRAGVLGNETPDQITRRIRGTRAANFKDGLMATTRRRASGLVRSSVLGVANEARLEMLKKNSDVVKGVQWISTLDSRTTEICMSLDGSAWDLQGNKLNGTAHPWRGPPPAHFNCRSTLSPVVKSFAEMASDPGAKKKLSAQIATQPPKIHPDAIKEYQAGGSKGELGGFTTLQRFLRTGSPTNAGVTYPKEQIEKVIAQVNESISTTQLASNKILYRGTRSYLDEFGVDDLSEIKKGFTFTQKGFTSTSSSKKVTKRFTDALNPDDRPANIVIKMKQGEHALDVAKHGDPVVGLIGPEKEWLLRSGQQFRVTNVRRGKIPTIELELTGKPPSVLARESVKESVEATLRASADGKVSGKLNYEGWLKTRPVAEQREILGPTKHNLWQKGLISFNDLIDQSHNPLTVAQLVQKAGLAAKKTVDLGKVQTEVRKTLAASAKKAERQVVIDAAKKELRQIETGQVKWLSQAQKQLAKTPEYNAASVVDKLKLVQARADKLKQANLLGQYKRAVNEGRIPSARATKAFEALSESRKRDLFESRVLPFTETSLGRYKKIKIAGGVPDKTAQRAFDVLDEDVKRKVIASIEESRKFISQDQPIARKGAQSFKSIRKKFEKKITSGTINDIEEGLQMMYARVPEGANPNEVLFRKLPKEIRVRSFSGEKSSSFGAEPQGFYRWKDEILELSDKSDIDVFIHEFGHHIDKVFLSEKRGLRLSTVVEERKKAARIAEEKWNKQNPAPHGADPRDFALDLSQDWMLIDDAPAVSNYALVNDKEWWAECFRVYVNGTESELRKLRQFAPETLKAIERIFGIK